MSNETQGTEGSGEPLNAGGNEIRRTDSDAAPKLGDTAGATTEQVLQILFNRSVEFSRSGFFFILLGCCFLFFAYRVLYQVHPTFVFILALLGMSIVLFGTGTQSIGSGEFSELGSPAKAKFYLAGGAGVLAGIFGFGAVLGAEKMERVFSNSSGYALVEFEINNPYGSNLKQAAVTTYLRDGRHLPVMVRDKTIEVLAPVLRGYRKVEVCIEVTGADRTWSIEQSCPTLNLKDNTPDQRPEPVQSLGAAKLAIKFVDAPRVDERGKLTDVPSFSAH